MSAFDSFSPPCDAGQQWNAHDYAIDAGFVPVLGGAVARLLDPQRGERILDLGCGDGVLSFDLALSGAHITGVDASPELVGGARARGIDAHVMDAHALAFDRQFDAVFSNAALHWMRGPDQVIAGVARALRPGGRFVAEMGGHGNVVAITSALQAALASNGHAVPAFPWYFPSADDHADRLRAQGFQVRYIEAVARPTALPTGMRGWLRTFASPFLAGLDAHQRQRVIDDAVALLAPTQCDARNQWTADYVRLRFDARLRTV
ncbi:methyltransferase domain-containing protein [Stenotrophomonas sp.]|uniref:methyltransferase domain-containing protein n=1 Tax=Stenotrophomonas sp. TaxID=69392 RepID=UPI002FC8C6DE